MGNGPDGTIIRRKETLIKVGGSPVAMEFYLMTDSAEERPTQDWEATPPRRGPPRTGRR